MSASGKDKSGRIRVRCSAHIESGNCPDPQSFYLDTIENTVLDGLRREMKHPDVIATYAHEYIEERRRQAAHVTENRARIERRLADAENAVQRAIRQIITGPIAENEAARVLAPLRADIAKIKAELAITPLPDKPVTLHPAALRRYERQLAQLRRALADGIAAGELEAHAAIRDLVERVIVSRDKSKPGGVQVDIRDRLAKVLGISVYPDAVRSGSDPISGFDGAQGRN